MCVADPGQETQSPELRHDTAAGERRAFHGGSHPLSVQRLPVRSLAAQHLRHRQSQLHPGRPPLQRPPHAEAHLPLHGSGLHRLHVEELLFQNQFWRHHLLVLLLPGEADPAGPVSPAQCRSSHGALHPVR